MGLEKEVCLTIEADGKTIEVPKGILKCSFPSGDWWQFDSSVLTDILIKGFKELPLHSVTPNKV